MNKIEKQIELNAPVSKVWRALTDYKQFGAWFGAKLEGPFVPGQVTQGQITIPGHENLRFEAVTEQVVPEKYFSYRWHPCGTETPCDKATEERTLVEFTLEEKPYGTLLRVVESGFGKLPQPRQSEAFRQNSEGWEFQLNNIQNHVTAS